ncbi:MAG: hypothetical protein DBX55_02330 [Verrucomicrobia bacterium]|nr:MAG: hypothetical protein DBX55_02330 [Verrucomicrobiota bacterium]
MKKFCRVQGKNWKRKEPVFLGGERILLGIKVSALLKLASRAECGLSRERLNNRLRAFVAH